VSVDDEDGEKIQARVAGERTISPAERKQVAIRPWLGRRP